MKKFNLLMAIAIVNIGSGIQVYASNNAVETVTTATPAPVASQPEVVPVVTAPEAVTESTVVTPATAVVPVQAVEAAPTTPEPVNAVQTSVISEQVVTPVVATPVVIAQAAETVQTPLAPTATESTYYATVQNAAQRVITAVQIAATKTWSGIQNGFTYIKNNFASRTK